MSSIQNYFFLYLCRWQKTKVFTRLNAPSTRLRIPTSPSSVNIAQPSFLRIPFLGFPFFTVSRSIWSSGSGYLIGGSQVFVPLRSALNGRPPDVQRPSVLPFQAFVRADNRLPYMATPITDYIKNTSSFQYKNNSLSETTLFRVLYIECSASASPSPCVF